MGHFTIEVPCKRYVKAYIENNCGNPANLLLWPELLREFRRCLKNKPWRREGDKVAKYTESVTVIILHDDFYRLGWEMNTENILNFNRFVEIRIKIMMRQYVALNHALGIPMSECIRIFQDEFGFPEHVWSFEAIKKDFTRNGKLVSFKPIKDLKIEIRKIFLANLSELGTVSPKLKKELING
jgi:hypothetical protein